ncbi:MAG: preprotein translocase subunit SecE [Flavobacteriales bacterium]
MIKYIQSSFKELKEHVTWPTFNELLSSTMVVFVATIIFALLVYGMDKGVYLLLEPILGVS